MAFQNCKAPGHAGDAATGANVVCLAATDTQENSPEPAQSQAQSEAVEAGSNTSIARDAKALTACILGNIDQIAAQFNAVKAAADKGNFWGVINRLRKAREFWHALAIDAKGLAEIADESDWPDWPDTSLTELEVWLNCVPDFGLSGRSRRFRVGGNGLTAVLRFLAFLEARQ